MKLVDHVKTANKLQRYSPGARLRPLYVARPLHRDLRSLPYQLIRSYIRYRSRAQRKLGFWEYWYLSSLVWTVWVGLPEPAWCVLVGQRGARRVRRGWRWECVACTSAHFTRRTKVANCLLLTARPPSSLVMYHHYLLYRITPQTASCSIYTLSSYIYYWCRGT